MRYFSLQLVFLLVLTTHATHPQNPASAEEYSQRGIASFEKNDLDGAIANFTKAIEMNGQNLEFCFYFRGIALYRLGRLDEALADLNKAIILKQHPRFYDDRGNLRAKTGDFDGALADLNKAIEIEPRYARAYGDRGIVRLLRGEADDAELDFKKCFELDKTLESQFNAATNHLKQQGVLRSEHKKPSDVEVVKFSWKEAPSQVLVATPQPAIPASTTAVSQTGLRVLGDPTEKGQPGPPPFVDSLSTTFPISRGSTTGVRGVFFKFTASIRNTGSKTIAGVQWAYVFYPKDRREPIAYAFATKANIPPGKNKDLTDQMLSTANSKADSKLPNKYNRQLFEERVVILRLDYADGSSWRSSGVSGPQKPKQ